MKDSSQSSLSELRSTSEKESSNRVRWSLEDLLPAREGELFNVFLRNLETQVVEFENARPELNGSMSQAHFNSLLEKFDEIAKLRSKLSAYAYLYFSEDTRLQESRTFKGRAEEIDTDVDNRTMFFELWWKGLESTASRRFEEYSGPHRYYLIRLRNAIPFTLDEKVEQAINIKDSTGKTSLLQLYHQIRESFIYELEIDRNIRRLTEEQMRDLFHSSNRYERKSSYEVLLSKFRDNSDVLGEIYKALAKDWSNEGMKLRSYASPIAIRNYANDVPDEAVAMLLNACEEQTSVFQDFFRLKSKLLGIDDFQRYDVYAPMSSNSQRQYTWEECMELILETFSSFDPKFAEMAKNVFSARHIDAEPREGKMGGAYCLSPTPDLTPYVLTSFTSKTRSVFTTAHELGHAVHSQMTARRSSKMLTFEAPLPLAETASVFAEMLLMERLLEKADAEERKNLIMTQLDDSYANIQRQAFFVLFEKSAHDSIRSGINVDDLSTLYLKNLKQQFGTSVSVPDLFRYEWNVIPHIYQTPFYCYAYAWGNLMVLALYNQYKRDGRDFVKRYLKVLSYGGSESPEKILTEAGFDIRSRAFWNSGYEHLKSLVSELRQMS